MERPPDGWRHLWRPGLESEDDPLVVEAADGVELRDERGRRYIDATASLALNVHGHRHPAIDIAICDQLDRVSHSTLVGLVHRPAIELARRLVELAPGPLKRVVYSDSGASARDMALELATYQRRAAPARIVVAGDGHDAAGPVGAGRRNLGPGAPDLELLHARAGDVADLERLLSRGEGEVVAVVVEPLVQAASGMLLQPEGYLESVRALCDRYGALLICDEVTTGFGRTGRMFACEHEGVIPDLLCLGGSLTGGYLPLGATLIAERVDPDPLALGEASALFRTQGCVANPLACAAALANLRLFEQEQTLERLQGKIALLSELLEPLSQRVPVGEVRQRGFMVGIELSGFSAPERATRAVSRAARRRGVIVQALGTVVVVMPPLSINERDLRRLVTIVREAIVEVFEEEAPLAA